ncbi:MAG: DNA-binding protein [Elusimicrobia bacterium CG06_land_8_20_14_3_00_38_11]|nr:MAG: DNA-binding protein [Elusimicrobia bacterium CG06_land_8_20_14_3_00_38_11]
MTKKNIIVNVPEARIEKRIFVIRGKKVMLDRDLAELYSVETRQLKRQVRRNIERFPDDFMFELTRAELENWVCQFGTPKDKMGLRLRPMVFTEHGILMLSSVLNSKKAIQVNIQIMRIFTKIRGMALTYEDLRQKIESMERRYDMKFRIIFDAIKDELPSPGEA